MSSRKTDVGMKFIDLLHRTYSVRRLAYNFNAFVFGQIATRTAAGSRLVIDSEDSISSCELLNGMEMMASQPRPLPPVSFSDASFP